MGCLFHTFSSLHNYHVYPGHVGYKNINENLVVFVLFISYFMLCFHISMHRHFSDLRFKLVLQRKIISNLFTFITQTFCGTLEPRK